MKSLLLATVALGGLNIFHAPEKDAGGGNAEAPTTLKGQLDQAKARISELEPKAAGFDQAKLDLVAEQGKVTALEGEKSTLTDRITALEGEKATLQTNLTNSQAEVTKLQGEAKTADQRAREIAAASGIHGVNTPKDGGGSNVGPKTAAELTAEMKAIKDPGQRTAFYRANKAAFAAAKATPEAA